MTTSHLQLANRVIRATEARTGRLTAADRVDLLLRSTQWDFGFAVAVVAQFRFVETRI